MAGLSLAVCQNLPANCWRAKRYVKHALISRASLFSQMEPLLRILRNRIYAYAVKYRESIRSSF